MVDERVRSAIATLALGFNEIEFIIEKAVAGLMLCRDDEVAEILVRTMPFQRKVELGKEIIKHYRSKHPSLERESLMFLAALRKTGDIKKRRNDLVHAITTIDTSTKESVLVRTDFEKVDTGYLELQRDIKRTKLLRDELFEAYRRLKKILDTELARTVAWQHSKSGSFHASTLGTIGRGGGSCERPEMPELGQKLGQPVLPAIAPK